MNFLQSIAQYYLDHRSGNNWDDLLFIFPSERSSVFFRNAVKEQLRGKNRTIFGINTSTIASLFADKANLHIPDNITLSLELWDVYKEIFKANNTDFEFFYSWSSTFISDFSDIDAYLIDARQILSNTKDFEAYRDNYEHLNESQREAIERFFGIAIKGDSKEYQHQFNETYKNLYPLYTQYRNSLKQKGLAYSGMVYREVAESLKDSNYFDDRRHYIFIGLNALSTAEQKVLNHLKTLKKADFFWDYPKDFLKDNSAALFLDKFSQDFPSPKDYIYPVNPEKPEILATSFAYTHAQIYGVNDFLKNVDRKEKNAIILSDENMLLPVISSLQDEDIEPVNVTMGYPVKQSQLYGFVDLISSLHAHYNNGTFYSKDVLKILQHACVYDQTAQTLIAKIIKDNKIRLTEADLSDFKHIFKAIDANGMSSYLKDVFSEIKVRYEKNNDLLSACATQIIKTINQFEKFLKHEELRQQNIDFLFSIFISLLRNETVDFCGYPLEGLQIMGILETRAVDFDNLVILDVNEGTLPKSSVTESFIPSVLRTAFGLPTYAFRDAMYAYYFFRLIYRAKHVHLLYNSSSNDNSKGKSRYLLQLEYQYKDQLNYSERTATQELKTAKVSNEAIKKDEKVMEKMKEFFAQHTLSPSLLTQYLTCGKMFYFANILGLSLSDDIIEDLDARVFGNIYHYAMEQILKYNATNIDRLLIDGFNKELHLHITTKDDLEGRNYLYYSVLHEYIEKTITIFPPKNAKILKCEEKVKTSIDTTIGEVFLGGTIDLQYLLDDKYYVLDYKTGKVDEKKMVYNPKGENLINKDKKEVVQTLIYCYILRKNGINSDMYPKILSLNQLYSKDFSTDITFRKRTISYDQVKAFEQQLLAKIDEIFDINIPFQPADNQDPVYGTCKYCPFPLLCQKSSLKTENTTEN